MQATTLLTSIPIFQRAMAPKRKLEANVRQRPVQDDDKDDDSEQTSDSGEDTSSDASGSSFPSEDEEEDSGSAADSDEDHDVSEIRVEFQFFGPEEKDFLGLKTLLSSYLNGEQYDSTGLVDAIISEGDVGSVVKTDEDDDPIAVMAVLNTTQYKDAAFMQQLRQFMLGNASAYSQQLAQSLDGLGTGLLINERLLNSPPSLAPPLLQFLLNEIKSRAAQDDEDAKNFQYQRLLLMTRIFVDSSVGGVPVLRSSGAPAPSAAGVTKHTKPGSSASRSVPQTAQVSQARTEVPQSALVFTRPEDEYLHAQCDWHFIFPVPDRPITKDGLVAHRLVMQVQMAKVLTAQKELDEVVGNMAAGFSGRAEGHEDAASPAADESSRAGPSQVERAQAQVTRLTAEALEAAAAAGAGPLARQGGKKKKRRQAA
ncbi:p21-C-terminal region-binding protein-domain-containing protein [Haematococcus lacustris]